MRGVAVLASVVITVVAAAAAAQPGVPLRLQPSILTGGLGPIAIASGYLDGDGNIDLVVANYDSDDVSVLWGNGDGTFTPAASRLNVSTDRNAEAPVAIAIEDINGDGKPDIVTANESAGTVSVLLNEGARRFAAAKESPTGMSPEALAIGNFSGHGDGKLDVATPNWLDDTVTVLLGNGDGTFSMLSPIPVGAEPYGLAAVDLNHDQILDLVAANSSGGEDYSGSLTVLRGVGDGTFVPQPEITSGTFNDPVVIAVGKGPTDLNGDQNPDLVVVNDYGDSLSVLLGKGDLTFQDAVALNLSEFSLPEGAVVGDFNGDGIPDIASSAGLQDKVWVFVGQGNGDFAAPVDFALPENSNPWGVAAGDFTGDGKSDLALADFTDPAMVSVLLSSCVGDCAVTGSVDVEDILRMVNIALGNRQIADCLAGDGNGDGQITVDEILTAVHNAVNGCGA